MTSVIGTCSICINDFETNDAIKQIAKVEDVHFVEKAKDEETKIVQLACRHFYHENCISTWFKAHRTCPECRFEVAQVAMVGKEETSEEALSRLIREDRDQYPHIFQATRPPTMRERVSRGVRRAFRTVFHRH